MGTKHCPTMICGQERDDDVDAALNCEPEDEGRNPGSAAQEHLTCSTRHWHVRV